MPQHWSCRWLRRSHTLREFARCHQRKVGRKRQNIRPTMFYRAVSCGNMIPGTWYEKGRNTPKYQKPVGIVTCQYIGTSTVKTIIFQVGDHSIWRLLAYTGPRTRIRICVRTEKAAINGSQHWLGRDSTTAAVVYLICSVPGTCTLFPLFSGPKR